MNDAVDSTIDSTRLLATALCSRIRAGDASAESEFVARYRPPLVRTIYGRVRDRSTAEDLTQDTLATVLQILRAKDLDDPGNLAAFVFATAKNLLRNAYRKSERHMTHVDAEAIDAAADERAPIDAEVQREQAARIVRTLLSELTVERDRELLVRAYLRDQDKEQICQALGLSAQHYERVIHRARTRFRTLLEERLGHAKAQFHWLLSALVSLLAYGGMNAPDVTGPSHGATVVDSQ
jgi:RNA polymerase sigma-70 factor, ECF subfamily